MAVVRAAGLQATVVMSRLRPLAKVFAHDHPSPVGPVGDGRFGFISKPVKVE
jgi:hypothetical protein